MTLSLGGIVDSRIYEKFAHCRWFKRPATPQVVLVLMVADNRSSPHHRPTWLKQWLPRPSFSTSLFKDSKRFSNSSSSGVGTMSTNLMLLATWTFWVLSPLCFIRWRSPWMRMLRFTQSSPSFLYLWCHVPMQKRPIFLRNNFMVPRAFGGTTISPCSHPIMLSLGKNSRMHSEPTIFQKGLWRGS
jgi:hypothetical protein